MNRSIRTLGRIVFSQVRVGSLGGLAVAAALLMATTSAATAAAETAEPAAASGAPADTMETGVSGNAAEGDRSTQIPAALSVAPLDHVEYPSDRPAWLERAPALGYRPAETCTVVSGPSETAEQSADRLRVLTRAAVASYIEQLTGAADADFFPVHSDWIESVLIEDRYAGTLSKGGMTMHESAVALRFPPEAQEEILAAWQETQLRGRLTLLAGGTAAVLVLLTAVSAGLNLIARSGRRRRAAASGAA